MTTGSYHFGNLFFEAAVEKRRREFVLAGRNESKQIAAAKKVLEDVRSLDPPGRFLKKIENGKYMVQNEEETLNRIRQALEKNDWQNTIQSSAFNNDEEKVRRTKYDKEDEAVLLIKELVESQKESEYLSKYKNPKADVMFTALSQLGDPLKQGGERKRALVDIVKGICANDPFICTVVENELKLTLDPVTPSRWNSARALEHTIAICCSKD